ncbi:hypothetical protein D9619_001865 [Psilocybe cf. subviscida]|uniref:F-box domain-containing protein n=1 Tax=Psilocybe cf. subviscida TaxID=2480587 RepID=A0A8H5F3E6_9AGAR|nr:hypothetical protein D9619_001865 [Psilocybe cf. subviscida]
MLATNEALATSGLPELAVHPPHALINDLRKKTSADLLASLSKDYIKSQTLASHSPISFLPMELLSRIFVLAEYDSPGERSKLADVCEYWRAVAMNTSELWTMIPTRCRISEMEEHLQRLKSLPLNVTIFLRLPEEKLREGYMKPIHVLHHLERIESLVVDLSTWRFFKGFELKYKATNKLCRRSAPKLRHLVLIRSDRFQHASAKSTSRMFTGSKLHHLKLHRVGIPWDSHLLSRGLTYFHLSEPSFNERFTLQQIGDILGRMPGL